MTITNILESERTQTYELGTFVQWADVTNAKKTVIVPAWNFTPSMDDFDIDRIDGARPIYTPKSDKKGTFLFNLKNAISLFDTAQPPTDELSLSKWMIDIGDGEPPEILFAPVMKAGKTNGSFPTNPFLNLIFTGRVLNLPLNQVDEQGVQDMEIIGDIINIAQIRRESTANNEG